MSPSSITQARRRDRLLGLSIIAVAFVACLALSLWAKQEVAPQAPTEPAPPTKQGLAGFPEKVRPFEQIERARTMTPRSLFQGFAAKGVERDGTLDFTKPKAHLRIAFQSPPGRGPQPERDRNRARRVYCGKQSVRITEHGMGARPDVTDLACPSKEPEELPLPKDCGIEDVWEVAKAQGKGKLPKHARIDYYRSHAGPAYRFVGGKRRFSLSASDCKTILEGRDQRGGVP